MDKLILVSLLFISGAALSAEALEVDRYTSIKRGATQTQLDPLTAVVQLQFPGLIQTTEQAINYALEDSGYKVVEEALWTPAMRIMMSNPLSIVHRDMSETPMDLRELLSVLAGEPFRVIQDPLRRKVSFVLKQQYQPLIGNLSDE